MANSKIQLPSDGSGKKVQTFENTIGGEVVQAEAVVEVDAAGVAVPAKATEASLAALNAKVVAVDTDDLATEVTVAALNAKVTAVDTSDLAKEAGGNLAAIAGKDFATQTSLALVKAKTDNLDITLSAMRNSMVLVPFAYDAIALGYTGSDLTSVRYYTGGLSGTLVATLTLTYDTGKLVGVVRT